MGRGGEGWSEMEWGAHSTRGLGGEVNLSALAALAVVCSEGRSVGAL